MLGVIVDEGEQAAPPTASVLQMCTSQIQDLVLGMLNAAVAEKLVGSMNCLRESFVGEQTFCAVATWTYEAVVAHLLISDADQLVLLGCGHSSFTTYVNMRRHLPKSTE